MTWHLLEIVALAAALGIDAAAVTAAFSAGGAKLRTLAEACALFGLTHAGMAWAGAVGGAWLMTRAAAWDHWVAFGLLGFLGVRMIVGASSDEPQDPSPSLISLIGLSIAMSLDALAAGVAIPHMGVPLPVAAVLIFATVALMSAGAAWIGRWLGAKVGNWATRAAGVVLIGLGIRILISHTSG